MYNFMIIRIEITIMPKAKKGVKSCQSLQGISQAKKGISV